MKSKIANTVYLVLCGVVGWQIGVWVRPIWLCILLTAIVLVMVYKAGNWIEKKYLKQDSIKETT